MVLFPRPSCQEVFLFVKERLKLYRNALTVLIPHTNAPQKALSTALSALLLASIVLVASAVAAVGALGPERASRVTYPFFTMVRASPLSESLERFEALVTVAWGFGLFIGISVFLFCGARLLSQVLGLSSYRLVLGPMAVLWASLSMHSFRDAVQIRSFFHPSVAAPLVIFWLTATIGVLWLGYGIKRLAGRKLE